MKSFDEIYRNIPEPQREELKRFRSTHPSRKCTSNGEWEYISCGKGDDAVLLLPGGFRFADEWFRLITALENEYRIVSPSYPPLLTMAEHVEGICDILESERIDSAHVVGISFGGWLAQCIVRQHPEKVKTLVLSNTSGHGFSRIQLIFSLLAVRFYPQRLFQAGIRKGYYSFLSVQDSEREFWKAYMEEISLKTTKDDFLTQRKCFLDFSGNYTFTQKDLVDWPGRLLILESDNDRAFDVGAREELKVLYPRAQVHTFHEAGHMPLVFCPKEYISVIKSFLRKPGEV